LQNLKKNMFNSLKENDYLRSCIWQKRPSYM